MKTKILLALSFLATIGFSQTKVIAFKSHSLHMEHFHLALENPIHQLSAHNLGASPEPFIKSAVLDTLIFVNDTSAVMITSEYCQRNPWYSSRPALDVPNGKTLWKSGIDTVYHHPLFTQQHALDSIKQQLKTNYYFRENIDSTVFIGYDNERVELEKRPRKTKRSSLPIVLPTDSSNGTGVGILIVALIVLSLFVGFLTYSKQEVKIYPS